MHDVKKVTKDFIIKNIRPVLYKNGFRLSKPTTYVRERNGLLQEFYFRVEATRLRPWVSVRPVFDARNIVTFGADCICIKDTKSPYCGFWWVTFDDDKTVDIDKLERLRDSIINGIIPELDELCSLEKFIQLYNDNGLLFQKEIRFKGNEEIYYDFIENVVCNTGIKRMEIIIKDMVYELQILPKAVREYLESYKGKLVSDAEADIVFEEYCNIIRKVNNL